MTLRFYAFSFGKWFTNFLTSQMKFLNTATNIVLQRAQGYLHYVPLNIALARALISSSFPRLHRHQHFHRQNQLALFSHPQQTLETNSSKYHGKNVF